ncbi:hypothetical protein E2C01_004673 [Portunus trituberculatus]|uniref:Uncharacterized protein n=1 Tax=Portunus trituberculatus TaxID=210409 RepID=A0A5B7CUK4_PORTR|nr:hypothetical protein [Portunus trituberculatus]
MYTLVQTEAALCSDLILRTPVRERSSPQQNASVASLDTEFLTEKICASTERYSILLSSQ